MRTEGTFFVATDDGLRVLDPDRDAQAGDAAWVDELAGREIAALAPGEKGPWALVEGKEIWRRSNTRWSRVASTGRRTGTCLAETPAGLLIGTTRGHLLHLEKGRTALIPSFDQAEGRDAWHTPWGAPADTRSISAAPDGSIYVNVHVGGVLRSTDGGAGWRPLLDIEHDVHHVLAPAGHPGLVLLAAYDGFGVSRDGGDTWAWENDGLHAHYCRAVELAGDTLILSASAGHHGRRAALYRRALGSREPWERCADGLPEWFPDNVDTGCVAALGETVVIGTEDGCVFQSTDAGRRWESVAKGLTPVRAVSFG
jgi:photosystem II stability/assembly factor-like uncharacterized protein